MLAAQMSASKVTNDSLANASLKPRGGVREPVYSNCPWAACVSAKLGGAQPYGAINERFMVDWWLANNYTLADDNPYEFLLPIEGEYTYSYPHTR